ncbi:MAG: sulfite exporter TauE/SafE family protein [Silicimonas sp.]|nr:sulfite exporter TauE/SafE family protein [Silicimonas sp.]
MIEHLHWLLIAAFVVGLGKGGLTGVAALAVPFLAISMNPVAAAAILLPIFIVTDWFAVWFYRRDYSSRNLAILVPAILAGIVLASFLVAIAPEALLLIFTGLVGVWSATRSWLGRGDTNPRPARVAPGIFWGLVTGITTFITHSGAPPTQAYLLPQRLPRLVFAGTMAITFAIGNLAKLPGYQALGYFDDLDWALVAGLTAMGVLGTAAGRWLVKRINDASYTRVIEALLMVLSLALFSKAWTLITGP